MTTCVAAGCGNEAVEQVPAAPPQHIISESHPDYQPWSDDPLDACADHAPILWAQAIAPTTLRLEASAGMGDLLAQVLSGGVGAADRGDVMRLRSFARDSHHLASLLEQHPDEALQALAASTDVLAAQIDAVLGTA